MLRGGTDGWIAHCTDESIFTKGLLGAHLTRRGDAVCCGVDPAKRCDHESLPGEQSEPSLQARSGVPALRGRSRCAMPAELRVVELWQDDSGQWRIAMNRKQY